MVRFDIARLVGGLPEQRAARPDEAPLRQRKRLAFSRRPGHGPSRRGVCGAGGSPNHPALVPVSSPQVPRVSRRRSGHFGGAQF